MQYTFRTSPPPTYISPSIEEMREMAKRVELKSFSRDLVADLCNLAAGGKVNPPSTYRDAVTLKVDETLPPPDTDGDYKKNNGKFTKNRKEAVDDGVSKIMKYHQNVCDFLQAIDLTRFPGITPLEQTMSLLKLLSKQKGGEGGGESGEPLPIFSEADRPENVAEKLEDLMDQVESLSQEEFDMLDPEGKNHEVENSDGQRTGSQQLNKLAIAEDLVEGTDKRTMLEVSRNLDTFSLLQVRKQVKQEEDPTGDEVRQRPLRNLSELSRVNKSEWAIRQRIPTYFLYRVVTHQVSVRERVTRIIRKQAIFIVLDGSGSMQGKKHYKASGVVMNRLKAVVTGDAEVWISVFDTDLTKAKKARTPEEARKIIKEFMSGNFRGGGTDIAAAVKAAYTQIDDAIKAGEALYKPEIVVLTDDDTSVAALKPLDIPGTRVHGFAIESQNPSLMTLAKATGGIGFENF